MKIAFRNVLFTPLNRIWGHIGRLVLDSWAAIFDWLEVKNMGRCIPSSHI